MSGQKDSKSSAGTLEIYVLGGRLGESIVIRTPRGDFGVIDAYAKDPADLASNPTILRLKNLGASRLRFVAMTHPHQDHFRGLPGVFLAFGNAIDEFWRPLWNRGDWASLLRTVKAELNAEPSFHKKQAIRQSGRLLIHLANLAQAEHKQHGMRSKFMNEGMVLLQEPEHDFAISCVAPSADLALEYQEGLAKNVVISGNDGSNAHHNLISSILQIKYGDWVGLFGGDTEQRAWREFLAQDTLGMASFFKVSHHGSPTGSFDDLWKRVQYKSFHAIVTSYAAQGLPTLDAIKSITNRSGIVHATTALLANSTATKHQPGPPLPISMVNAGQRGEVVAKVARSGRIEIMYNGAAGRFPMAAA